MPSCRPLRSAPLVASLAVLTASISAADFTGGVQDATPRAISDNGRRVYVTGLVDLDYVKSNNTTDGSDRRPDMRGEGWGRAELGSRVVLDDRVEVGVTVGYVSQAGNNRPLGYEAENPPAPGTASSPEDSAANGHHSSGDVTLEDAFVHLPNFLGMRQLDVLAGRQVVAWNLRKGRTAWLFDSRSQNRAVTRWDGVQAKYDVEFMGIDVDAFAFRLPDDSSMLGGMLDWKVIDNSEKPLWVTGGYMMQQNPLVSVDPTNASAAAPRAADSLNTAYVGIDLDLSTFELYGEFAMQRGDVGAGSSARFSGWGMNLGIDWRVLKDSSQEYILGFQYERLSGDDNAADDDYSAFVNTWEATSDTYIFEHEKYGQISRLLVGNLHDYKFRMEYSLLSRVRMAGIWGHYQSVTTVPGMSDNLGNEYDLTLSWDYNGNTSSMERSGGCTFTLFGGFFKPNSGYEDLIKQRNGAANPDNAGTDTMWTFGANVLAKF